jgi:DNA-binding CsgD family transcriptional regulator
MTTQAAVAGGSRPRAWSPRGDGALLLERERELAALDGVRRRAAGGTSEVVLVAGARGMGRTALFEAACEQARLAGFVVLRARGDAAERELPFGVVRQLLGPLARQPEGRALVPPRARPVLARLLDETSPRRGRSGDPADHHGQLEAFHELVVALSTDRPLLVAVDDLHVGDPASCSWLHYVSRRRAGLRLAFVATHRTGRARYAESLVREADVQLLTLAPLSARAVRQLARHVPAGDDDEFCRACHVATGGAPGRLRELLVALVLGGSPATGPEAARALRRVVLDRLRALPPDALALARALAVLGPRADVAEAAGVAGLDPTRAWDAVTLLGDAGLVGAGPAVGLAHAVVRDAVLAEMGAQELAAAHAAAARVLHERGAPADAVADHLLAPDPAGAGWVAERLEEGARRATAQGDHRKAAVFLRRALEEPPPPPVRSRLQRRLGVAGALLGDPRSLPDLRQALAASTTADDATRAALALGNVLRTSGRLGEAGDVLAAAHAGLADADHPLRGLLDAERAALGCIDIERPDRRTVELDDELLVTRTDRLFGAVRAYRAVLGLAPAERSAALARRALAAGRLVAEAGSHALAPHLAADVLVMTDRLREAEPEVDALVEHARRLASAPALAFALALRARLALARGDLAGAEADAERGLDAAARGELVLADRMLVAALMEVALARGRPEDAEAAYARRRLPIVVSASATDDLLLAARGRLRVAQDRFDEGYSDLMACGERQLRRGVGNPAALAWRSWAAEALARTGATERALELLLVEERLARVFGAPVPHARALRLLARVGEDGEALGRLEEAARLLDGSPARLEHARVLLALGRRHRRHGRGVEGRRALVRARRLALECGAAGIAESAAAELDAREQAPRGRHAPPAVEQLSARERETAELARDDFSNRQIADRLHVTGKTVEAHLSAAYRKLGIRSRFQLAEALEVADLARASRRHASAPTLPSPAASSSSPRD